MGHGDDDDHKGGEEKRFGWLQARIIASLKCKEDKAQAMFTADENKAALFSFLDDSESRRLLVYDAGKGLLAVSPGRAGGLGGAGRAGEPRGEP